MKHFVHIPRTGGMSIRRGFPELITTSTPDRHCSPAYTAQLDHTMSIDGEHHGHEHARWRDLHVNYQNNCFAVVRNPWDRAVSRWHFGVIAEGRSYSFAEFLQERHHYGGRDFYWHRAIRGWYPQLDYVTDEAGRIRCDVLRFGTDDAARYLGVNELPHRNQSGHEDYRSYYGTAEYEIIEEWYRTDIDTFGFTFDAGATENLWTPGS